jgi:predicted DNA-binding transcriptional regulator AlpA
MSICSTGLGKRRVTPETPPQKTALLSVNEAAAFLGMSRSWLTKTRVTGNGPVATVIGRRVLYTPQALDAFVASRQQASTSEKNRDAC